MNIEKFWKDVVYQNKDNLLNYFSSDAVIRWHCTNEQFSVDEYIKVNCEYPGEWYGEIERKEEIDNMIISVVKIYSIEKNESYHVVNFMKLKENLIVEMDEYWSDDGDIPDWRRDMNIGKKII